MTSSLQFVIRELVPDLLILVGVYHLVRWSFDHRRKQPVVLQAPWRIYVKPFEEHYFKSDYGSYGKKSEAGVEVGISNGKTTLKVGEVLMANARFEIEMTKLQEAAETRLHIIELETTQ